jgi:transposase
MMGTQVAPAQLFHDFCLDDQVPANHLLRQIDRLLDLESVRAALKLLYGSIGRPSVDPELMMGMLIAGYCFGVRFERRLCELVHLNLAYRWFCRLGLDGKVSDTLPCNRQGRFRQSDILRHLFETTVAARDYPYRMQRPFQGSRSDQLNVPSWRPQGDTTWTLTSMLPRVARE